MTDEADLMAVVRGTSPVCRAGAAIRVRGAPGDPAGLLMLEGAVYRAGAGTDPLDALRTRLAEHGPAAFAQAEGDFVACYLRGATATAFKSFTSQHQLYLREGDGLLANRLYPFGVGGYTLDADYFARHTLIVPGMQFHMRRTPLDGVERVLPGEAVTVGERIERRQLVTRRYAYRLDPAQTGEDAAPGVVARLRAAIADQLAAHPRAPLCVEISGGLDSSFVACLLAEAAGARPVRGIMFSRPDVPSHRVSEDYAREVAARYGIELTILAPDGLPPTPQAPQAYGDEPSDFFWFGELFSEAVARWAAPGALVFTGFGADQLFLRSSAFLPYLVARRRWREFARSLAPAARLLNRSRVNLALQSLVSQIPRERYYRLAGRFAGRRWNPLDVSDVDMHRMLYSPVAWLARGGEQEGFETERLAAEAALVGGDIICDDWGYFAAPRAVAAPHFGPRRLIDASPFCDLRLIDYVYDEVSALLVHDFEGRYKELLRTAAAGVLPESLRGRRNDTFVFNTFQREYIGRAKTRLRGLIEQAPAGWIDAGGALAALEQLEFGVMTSSTRSLVALAGYLAWREAFAARVAGAGRSGAGDPAPLRRLT